MSASARRRLLGRNRKAVFHCWTRCVRRAFLCGIDPLTGKDYSHRRDWIMSREEQLAGLLALEIEFRTEMSNHLHLVLRTRPEIAERWSAQEVARRWLTATKMAKCMSDDLPEPDPRRVAQLAQDKKGVEQMRRRLSNVSWFMGLLLENIARRANREDGTTGRFWETRFKCRECTDLPGLLLCGIYVDLNPIRAGEADTLETARYTSVFQRLMAQQQGQDAPDRADGWMAELTLQPETLADVDRAYQSRTGRRASDLGSLPISLDSYVRLLQWTVEQFQSGARSTIPRDLGAVLERLTVNQEAWLESVTHYENAFGHAVGAPDSLNQVAQRMGRQYVKGKPACQQAFG